MESERTPFDCPEKVSSLMAGLFNLYITYYPQDSFPVWWLQKTEDLNVCCRDTSSEKVAFTTSPELLKAIHRCKRVTAPEQGPLGLPSDWGFAGFMTTAAYQILDEVPLKSKEYDDYF
jgi:hypothetical protein